MVGALRGEALGVSCGALEWNSSITPGWSRLFAADIHHAVMKCR